jgi:hypothetical protein
MDNLSIEDKGKFKLLALKYCQLDDDINKLQQALRERNKLKKKITENLLDFMKEHNIDDLKTDKGILRYDVKLRTIGLSKKLLQEKLEIFLKDELKAKECFKFIENRGKKEIVKLVREDLTINELT